MTRNEIQRRIDNNEKVIELGEVTFDVDDSLVVPAGRAPLAFRGRGKDATVARAGSGFVHSEGVTVRFHDMAVVAQVPHVGMVLETTGGGADIEATGCLFKDFYDGLWGQWAGGMLRVSGCEFRNFARHAIYGESNVGYWVARIVDNYFDGRESEGLINLCGIHAGGLVSKNYMQASKVHISVDAAASSPVNELLIDDNMLDQDSSSDAAVRIRGDGLRSPAGASNCIKLSNNYVSTTSVGYLLQDACNVTIEGGQTRWSGPGAAVLMAAGNAARTASVRVQGVGFHYFGSGSDACIRSTIHDLDHIRILNNTGLDSPNYWVKSFVELAGPMKAISVSGNSPGAGCGRLVSAGTGARGNGEVICRNNVAYNSPYVAATELGGELTLPIADECQVVAVEATGTPINRIVGLTARQGVRVTLLSAALIQFRKPATLVDGSIGADFDLEPFKPKVVLKFADNLWWAQ